MAAMVAEKELVRESEVKDIAKMHGAIAIRYGINVPVYEVLFRGGGNCCLVVGTAASASYRRVAQSISCLRYLVGSATSVDSAIGKAASAVRGGYHGQAENKATMDTETIRTRSAAAYCNAGRRRCCDAVCAQRADGN